MFSYNKSTGTTHASRAKAGLPHLAALLFFLPACLLGARTIPEIPRITSPDGRPAGLWSEMGMNTEHEAALGASRWLRWDESGLYYAFLLPDARTPDHLLVEIYIDTRPEYEKYLYEYRKGAGQFKVELKSQAGKMTARLASSFGFNDEARLACHAARTAGGLSIEGHIPWECLPSFSPKPGVTLAFDSRLRAGRNAFVGCQDVDKEVTPDNNPELLEVYRLAEAGAALPAHPSGWAAEEAVENGRPVLYLHWSEARDASAGEHAPSLQVDIPEMKIHEAVPLNFSVAEKFLWWTERIPIDPATAPASVSVTFARGSLSRTIHVPLNIADATRRVEKRLEPLAGHGTDEESRRMLALFRDCMMEEIRSMQTRSEGIRPARRRYNEADNFDEPEFMLDGLAALAKKTFTTPPKAGSIRTFCWMRPDGVPSPFKVYYPATYDPAKKYPVVFHLRGYNRYGTRSHYLMKTHWDTQLYVTDKSDFFVISVFGGGNNNEFCGFDELNYLAAWAGENLNIDETQMMLRGHSWGGTMALYLGARMPGLFACIDAMSADPVHAVAGGGRKDALVESLYVPNLKNTKVRLTVGALDRKALVDANKRMCQKLHDAGIDVSLDIIPNAGHDLKNRLPPPAWGRDNASRDAGRLSYFRTDTPMFRHAYGVEILERRNHGRPAGFELRIQDGKTAIKTENIARLRLNSQWKPAPEKMEIDGRPLAPAPLPGAVLEISNGAWAESDGCPNGKKSSMRPGTMMDFIGRGFIIVYGTQDPQLTPHLVERAYDIARQVSGTARRQWAGRVIAMMTDVEFLKNTPANRDILLLGSPGQNSAAAALCEYFPQGIAGILDWIDNDTERDDARLLQAVMPVPDNPKHYYFLEAGDRPLAYTGVFLKEPFSDYVMLSNRSGWKLVKKGTFDNNWKLLPAEPPQRQRKTQNEVDGISRRR